MEIISRQDALSQNLTYYFTGKPCKHGHTAKRNTKDKTCDECKKKRTREINKKRYHEDAAYKEYQRQWKQDQRNGEQREKVLESQRQGYQRRKAAHIETGRIYQQQRRSEDPGYKIAQNQRSRLNKILGGSTHKDKTTMEFLGCTRDELIKHLESLFQPGMNWDNYGLHGWHVDHVRPCASFDFTNPKDIAECFHFSNLQPLWCLDNIRKSDKVISS